MWRCLTTAGTLSIRAILVDLSRMPTRAVCRGVKTENSEVRRKYRIAVLERARLGLYFVRNGFR